MKNILIFIPNLQAGGAEKIAVNLSNILAKENYLVNLMFIKKSNFNLKSLNKKINLVNLKKKRLFLAFFPIMNFLIHNKKNLHIISFLNAPNLLFCFLKFFLRLKKIKLTITIHNSMSDSFRNSNLKGKIVIYFLKFFYIYADKIICVSNYVRKDLIKIWKIKKNIFTIYNPAINKKEIDRLSKIKNTLCNEYKLKKYKIILSVGRLTKQKNYPLLLNAFSKITKKINKIVLIILGTGEQKHELLNLVKSYKLTKKVLFLNFQKNPFNFIKNSDIVALSSNWEGLPTILIESLYLKKKIVSTNCNGGCSEVLKNGKYGNLVPMNDPNSLANKIIYSLENKKKKLIIFI